MTFSMICLRSVAYLTSGSCWVEMTVVHATGLPVAVLHGDLALAVGPDPREDLLLADLLELQDELVRHVDGHGHQFFGFATRVAEHQALVAGPLFLVEPRAFGDALRDVGALPVQGHHDRTVLGVEAHGRVGVADVADGLPHHVGNADHGLGGDLAGHDGHARGDHGFAGHAARGVLGDHGIENGVGDAVGHLVRVAHGDRLAGEVVMVGSRVTGTALPPGGRRAAIHGLLALAGHLLSHGVLLTLPDPVHTVRDP